MVRFVTINENDQDNKSVAFIRDMMVPYSTFVF